MDLDKLSNILGQDTIKKIYEDAGSQPMQEVGKALTDLLKTARLFTAPIQLLASYQDRLSKYFEKVRSSVKEENQIEAPSSISGPIIERLKYLEDENYLTELYLNLLRRAIDKERVHEAHPAFYHIIDQLSADEAMLLYVIKQGSLYCNFSADLYYDENQRPRFKNNILIKSNIPKDQILFFEHFDMYIHHMESLNLVEWKIANEKAILDNIEKQIGVETATMVELTDFGYLFVSACIPKDGFIIIK